MTQAERQAKSAAKHKPATTAYASALIDDLQDLLDRVLLEIPRASPFHKQSWELFDRAKRRRDLYRGKGLPHLAEPGKEMVK